MPASFKVLHDPVRKTDTIIADFGESAIGRVAPVDSGFWWIILLRAYTKSTGDLSLAETPECQKGMRLILTLCLSEGFDTFPTLLCADGCSMIDRRMVSYPSSLNLSLSFVHVCVLGLLVYFMFLTNLIVILIYCETCKASKNLKEANFKKIGIWI